MAGLKKTTDLCNNVDQWKIVGNSMHVFYDCCQLRDLRQMFTYERFMNLAVGHDFWGHELSLPYQI